MNNEIRALESFWNCYRKSARNWGVWRSWNSEGPSRNRGLKQIIIKIQPRKLEHYFWKSNQESDWITQLPHRAKCGRVGYLMRLKRRGTHSKLRTAIKLEGSITSSLFRSLKITRCAFKSAFRVLHYAARIRKFFRELFPSHNNHTRKNKIQMVWKLKPAFTSFNSAINIIRRHLERSGMQVLKEWYSQDRREKRRIAM